VRFGFEARRSGAWFRTGKRRGRFEPKMVIACALRKAGGGTNGRAATRAAKV
jgi:hypothetical protein